MKNNLTLKNNFKCKHSNETHFTKSFPKSEKRSKKKVFRKKLCDAIKALTLKRLRGQFEIVEQVIVE